MKRPAVYKAHINNRNVAIDSDTKLMFDQPFSIWILIREKRKSLLVLSFSFSPSFSLFLSLSYRIKHAIDFVVCEGGAGGEIFFPACIWLHFILMTHSDQPRRVEFQFEKFKIGSKWHNFNFGQKTLMSFPRVLQF